jgi:hypothetical protein
MNIYLIWSLVVAGMVLICFSYLLCGFLVAILVNWVNPPVQNKVALIVLGMLLWPITLVCLIVLSLANYSLKIGDMLRIKAK